MVTLKFYDFNDIFMNDSDPKGMCGKSNIRLTKSFYHIRDPDESHVCNDFRHDRYEMFKKNAGALQLYQNDGVSLYEISKNEGKEYHIISLDNIEFSEFIDKGNKELRSTYGHSERMLMRDVLDDLIPVDSKEILRPSDKLNCKSWTDEKAQDYEILKNLTEYPRQYKDYLISQGIIVKMWSERPCCNEPEIGGDCTTFMKNICPNGSQYGYTVKDYNRKIDQRDGASKIKKTFEEFKNAYKKYKLMKNSV